MSKNDIKWWLIIAALTVGISVLHYTTPTLKHHYHLIFMQAYFVPILLAAFQFGIKGGVGIAIAVSVLYLPHIMFQWGGLTGNNLMRFLQIFLFNIIGYLTGLKSQRESEEKQRYLHAAEQLRASLNSLEMQGKQLAEMQEQLGQLDRLAVVGEMSANMAHEIRNPLGSIRGIADILKDEIPSSPKTDEFISILVEETRRLNSVVDNYLGMVRTPQTAQESFEVNSFLQSLLLFFQIKAQKQQINFQLQPLNQPKNIQTNLSQLRQVMINILLNALEATPTGGNIILSAEMDGDNLSIQIVDDGPGIPEKISETIFQPLFSTKKSGTGLGLSIVKRIVSQNNWQLSLQSVPGRTQFNLRIHNSAEAAQ